MLTKLNKKRDEKGFTLIELMIVIAIIGILAAIAIPQFNAYRQRSYNAAAVGDLRNAITSQEAYFVDNDTYSTAVANLQGANYGLILSGGVALSVTAGTTSGYTMTSRNGRGTITYSIAGPGGSITP
jgi:type IV pilus assembly protein PilA